MYNFLSCYCFLNLRKIKRILFILLTLNERRDIVEKKKAWEIPTLDRLSVLNNTTEDLGGNTDGLGSTGGGS
jgi:hypothetical protein